MFWLWCILVAPSLGQQGTVKCSHLTHIQILFYISCLVRTRCSVWNVMHSCCSLICLSSLPTHCPHWIMMPCSGYSKAGIMDSLYEHDLNIVPRGSLIQKSCWYWGAASMRVTLAQTCTYFMSTFFKLILHLSQHHCMLSADIWEKWKFEGFSSPSMRIALWCTLMSVIALLQMHNCAR